MRKSIMLLAFGLLLAAGSYAQKKVAVVTFYINKHIDVTALGDVADIASMKLADDPLFNLAPLLKDFHEQFFTSYAKTFPFELLPEEKVLTNEAYRNYTMPKGEGKGILNVYNYLTPYDGYKIVVPFLGHENEKELVTIFNNQSDGVMVVNINFALVKIGLGGMGVVKVMATANMLLFNKNGDRVFTVEEDAKSKMVSPMVGGVPVMTAEKILPMCQSALIQLMDELPKALPKIVRKADAKL